MNLVPNNLRALREERRITQDALAVKAGVSVYTVSKIENGAHCLVATKRKLLKGLGLTWEDRHLVWKPSDTGYAPDRILETDEFRQRDAGAGASAGEDLGRPFGADSVDGTESTTRDLPALFEKPAATNGFAIDVATVHELVDQQAAKGAAKYPESEARRNLGAAHWIRATQQELIDAVVYLERTRRLLEGSRLADHDLDALIRVQRLLRGESQSEGAAA